MSVCQHTQLVEAHIAQEVMAYCLLVPLPEHFAIHCHTSPVGLIPKPHQPGTWRLIVDLSSPHVNSFNYSIASSVCHMHYLSVLNATDIMKELGPGTLLAKMALRTAATSLSLVGGDPSP